MHIGHHEPCNGLTLAIAAVVAEIHQLLCNLHGLLLIPLLEEGLVDGFLCHRGLMKADIHGGHFLRYLEGLVRSGQLQMQLGDDLQHARFSALLSNFLVDVRSFFGNLQGFGLFIPCLMCQDQGVQRCRLSLAVTEFPETIITIFRQLHGRGGFVLHPRLGLVLELQMSLDQDAESSRLLSTLQLRTELHHIFSQLHGLARVDANGPLRDADLFEGFQAPLPTIVEEPHGFSCGGLPTSGTV
mmetsp:Transcript_33618/g.53792  ORF Transcript_33618/g.53792 Transcript_33618/m.53792 type:complete len:242 (+) Transcript_33618:1178-1903(+)